jgi:hypothetical protein
MPLALVGESVVDQINGAEEISRQMFDILWVYSHRTASDIQSGSLGNQNVGICSICVSSLVVS